MKKYVSPTQSGATGYGYQKRTDPATRVLPADQPPARTKAVSRAEGISAGKSARFHRPVKALAETLERNLLDSDAGDEKTDGTYDRVLADVALMVDEVVSASMKAKATVADDVFRVTIDWYDVTDTLLRRDEGDPITALAYGEGRPAMPNTRVPAAAVSVKVYARAIGRLGGEMARDDFVGANGSALDGAHNPEVAFDPWGQTVGASPLQADIQGNKLRLRTAGTLVGASKTFINTQAFDLGKAELTYHDVNLTTFSVNSNLLFGAIFRSSYNGNAFPPAVGPYPQRKVVIELRSATGGVAAIDYAVVSAPDNDINHVVILESGSASVSLAALGLTATALGNITFGVEDSDLYVLLAGLEVYRVTLATPLNDASHPYCGMSFGALVSGNATTATIERVTLDANHSVQVPGLGRVYVTAVLGSVTTDDAMLNRGPTAAPFSMPGVGLGEFGGTLDDIDDGLTYKRVAGVSAGHKLSDGSVDDGGLSWAKIAKVGSSLADLAARAFTDLTFTGLTAGRFLKALTATTVAFAQITFSDVSGVLGPTAGGTGLSAYTLGDVLYGSGTNVLSALAGNITTTRKFLRQTGAGAVSAAPAWDTIVAADVPGSALTKTDDTNVTLTLAGSASTALLNAASITVGWTGTLGLARGGTHADLSATGGTHQVLQQSSSGANITVGQLTLADIAAGTAPAGTFSFPIVAVTSGLTLTGATITGAPTWSSNQAITLSTAAQPNITSLGTLTGLTMGGTLTMGANTLALASATVSGAPTWSSTQTLNTSGTAATVTGATQAAITSAANLVTVGALVFGSIAAGFGNINNAGNSLTTGALVATTESLTSSTNNTAGGSLLTLNRTTPASHSQEIRFAGGAVSGDMLMRRKANSDTLFIQSWDGASIVDLFSLTFAGAASFGANAVTMGALTATSVLITGKGGWNTGTDRVLNIGGALNINSNSFGIVSAPSFGTAVTNLATAMYTSWDTTAASWTAGSVFGLYVDNGSKGAGSNITNQYGIYIAPQTQGATNWSLYTTGAVNTGALTATTVTASTSVLSTILDSNAASDLLLKRNASTKVTVGASGVTFADVLTVNGNAVTVGSNTSINYGALTALAASGLILKSNSAIEFQPGGAFRFALAAAANSTGGGSALLGANSPASTLTAPYTWVKAYSDDGSTVYFPVWK